VSPQSLVHVLGTLDVLVVQDFVVEGEEVGGVHRYRKGPLGLSEVNLPHPALHARVQDNRDQGELQLLQSLEDLWALGYNLHVLAAHFEDLLRVVGEYWHQLLSDAFAPQAEVRQLGFVLISLGLLSIEGNREGVGIFKLHLFMDICKHLLVQV